MRILIIHAPTDTDLARQVARAVQKPSVEIEYWQVQKELNAETILNLFMNAYTHFLCIINSEEDYYHPWLYTVVGYCMGRNRNLACFYPEGTIDRPEFLMWVPQIIHFQDVVNYYEIEEKEWRRYEQRETARNTLVNLGCALSEKGFAEAVAAHENHAVELYLDVGYSPDSEDENGVTMLCLAARNRFRTIAGLLIQRGADVNRVSSDRGNTPLMEAASEGSVEIVDLILAAGVNLNVVSKNGQTALVLAVGRGDPHIAEKLLRAGADPEIRDKLGMSARQYAQLFKMEKVLALIESGNIA